MSSNLISTAKPITNQKRNKMKKKFYAFLKDNNCLLEYLLNMSSYKQRRSKIKHPRSYITGAFLWSDTTEGYDFWWNVDQKWQTTYYN